MRDRGALRLGTSRSVAPLCGAVALALGLLMGGPAARAVEDRPNVVLVMMDDFGAECVGAYGSTSYETPHMDRLAETGMRFTNAYTTPLCTPTRVQIMSGQYPFRNGWPYGIWTRPRDEQRVAPERLPLGSMMQEAGYRTAVAGKWQLARFADHPDHATRCGFDAHSLWTWVYEPPEGAHIGMERGPNKPSRFHNPGVWQNGRLLKDTRGQYGPDIYCDLLVDFVREHHDEPFFLYFPMALTHNPTHNPPGSDAEGRQAKFAAMVRYTDKLIGRIVKALAEHGVREETLILITGDNGTPGGIRSKLGDRTVPGGKGDMTEAGARVPLIANWPGTVPSGRVCRDLVDTSDVLPTLTDLTPAEAPGGMTIDGRSFAPQLRGEEGDPREWVYVQLRNKWYMRGQRYRLHGSGALYDMSDRYDAEKLSEPLGSEAAQAKKRLRRAYERLRGSK